MWEHFKTNLPYRIISLLLAISLWAWVTTAQNPIKEALYEVPLESRDLSADLMVADKPSTVKVRVQARDSVLAEVTSRDYQAYVDLSGAHVGTNTVPVEVTTPAGVELVNTSPSQVPIVIDQITQIQMPVRSALVGSAATGFAVLDPTVSPSEVLIAGPKSILDRISDVVVDVALQGHRESYLERVPIKILDEEGNPLQDWLKLQPDTVEVFVPVIRELPSKRLVIKPVFEGDLPANQTLKQVVVDPEMVQLFGRWELLGEQDYLYTEPIDLSQWEGTGVIEVELAVPEGTYLGVPGRVKVIIETE
ncbi:MAG: hypothetical protein GX262_09115 [Clostridia bacterium]|jgi:YbbR domain-containing protein|nr:hypothetical protein [Clostridia bacterium]